MAGNIELLAEAITFLQAYGVDIDAAVKVLGGGLAGSAVLDQKAPKMLQRNFDPGFRIALHHKDLGIVTAAAREAGVDYAARRRCAQLMALRCRQWRWRTGPFGPAARASSGCPGRIRRVTMRLLRITRIRKVKQRTMPRCARSTRPSAILEIEGATQAFGLPGAAINPFYSAMRAHGGIKPHPGPPRRRRQPHGGGIHPRGGRQHRHLHRHVRPGGDRHDHRTVLGHSRFHSHPLR